MSSASCWGVGLLFSLAGLSVTLRAQGLTLRGRIVDETGTPVAAARLVLRLSEDPGRDPARSWQAESGPAGNFEFSPLRPGDYLVTVTRAEYFEVRARALHLEGATEITLVLNHLTEVFQALDVTAEPSPLDTSGAQRSEHLTGTEINNVPFPSSHNLRSSLRLMPGALLDPAGELHVNGSSENQLNYQLNGYNITSPIAGQFTAVLPVEGVRTLDFTTGGEPDGGGKGTAGTLSIASDSGSDVFRSSFTNFIPGLSFQQGVRLNSWYPRLAVSGPILRGRAWFADSFGFEHVRSLVTGLPKGENTRTATTAANLLHGQFNWTPTHILFADLLVNVSRQSRYGLGSLDPIPTTSDRGGHEFMAGLRDSFYFVRGALVEFGYAHNSFSTARTPRGTGLYIFSADGRAGNYFVNSRQFATRDQFLLHGVPPTFRFAGSHRLDFGTGAEVLGYDADFRRTGYELVGLSGYALSSTLFQGNGVYRVPDTRLDWHVSDTWLPRSRLQLVWGLRWDRDRYIAASAWSPWAGFSWTPRLSGLTTISGGYSISRDAVPLAMLGRPLDQFAVTTPLDAAGSPAGPPVQSVFLPSAGGLVLPRAENWNMDLDRQILERYHLGLRYLRRRLRNGFVYVNGLAPDAPPYALPLPNGALPGAYQLANRREDRFSSAELSLRRAFAGQYELMVSYTYSQASSNSLLLFRGQEPLSVLPSFVPLPWDAPHRVLGWTYIPLPWKNWALAAMFDARRGFPFSVTDQTGRIVGPVNSSRFPWNADLNLAVERLITLRGYRFALRVGANNLTNQANFAAVNSVTGSPHFMQFYGREGRHYVVRVRFFGRAKGK